MSQVRAQLRRILKVDGAHPQTGGRLKIFRPVVYEDTFFGFALGKLLSAMR